MQPLRAGLRPHQRTRHQAPPAPHKDSTAPSFLRVGSQEAVRLALAGYHRLAAADEATAAFADMPVAGVASPTDTTLVPIAPIAWHRWRDAWERLRGDA